ncbi:RagB/SusD family nutrient uptake outer membrane protein [Sphingobacterium sp. MYb382]|uniref:RagB/SusD family nutrient uptake outer membrane protein n=1 Tax=Sphingobacterium sp. MYb382 TaxID=2745278 RepID=UPI0030B00423
MKLQKIIFLILCLIGLNSCSKWIDVKPTDRLAEDLLYKNKEGYIKAISGVYSEMTNNSLYGRFMTAGAVDVLSQYYFINSTTNGYYNYTMFDYTQGNTKGGFDNAWKKAYELIVNLNVIIDRCGDSPSAVLPASYYGTVKGEALALRAMLHFDLLRLFGPIWSETNKTLKTIPYTTGLKNEVTPLLTAEQVINLIESDLNQAVILLQAADPIIQEGVRNGSNTLGTNDLFYRQYRLNYFAAKALLARTYLWKGDKVKALATAQDIIQSAKINGRDIFPFVTSSAATSSDKPDRMFSTEVLFSLYSSSRFKLYEDVFSPNQEPFNRLTFNNSDNNMARVDNLYDDKNDYRYRIWENVNVGGKLILANQKFKDYNDAPGRFMMPLIRLSELYLIAAETTTNLDEAKQYLNKVRTNRNTFSLNPSDAVQLKNFITAEYRKEFIGEGQMFYYYKRNASTMIPNHAALVGEKAMPLGNYRVPLPESEISVRLSIDK